jgi:hypothetical protein
MLFLPFDPLPDSGATSPFSSLLRRREAEPASPRTRSSIALRRRRRVLALVWAAFFFCAMFFGAIANCQKIVVNERYPIANPTNGTAYLSPPLVESTNQCSIRVKVTSFIPGATINVYLMNPVKKLIGGPKVLPLDGLTVPLTQPLKAFDQIEATQTVLGVTSALSAPMIAGPMLTSLPKPTIGANIYACGVIAPVYNLVSGVTVEVFDKTTGSTTPIGKDSTPDDWGSNWDPVLTSALDAPPKAPAAHEIYAVQSACNGAKSDPGPDQVVQAQTSPVNEPNVVSAIVGNDTVTLDKLLTGAIVQVFNGSTLLGGPGAATGDDNWLKLTSPLTAAMTVRPVQTLCQSSTGKKTWPTTKSIPPPVLLGPICPAQGAAFVRDSTINAALVLLIGGVPAGYGGAALGDVPVDIAPPAVFATGDEVQTAEYFTSSGSPPAALSNKIKVGCVVHTRQDIAKLTLAQIASLRKGIGVMMERSYVNPDDPTGFTFQANIHSTVNLAGMCPMGDPSNPLWDQCQHYSDLFFAWHRMYLYYFERILRAASGDPNLALPYWNYEPPASELTLPSPYMTPTSDCADSRPPEAAPVLDPAAHPGCNPLYVPGRPASIPASAPDMSMAMADTSFEGPPDFGFGGGPPPGTPPAACHFDSAQGDLENNPHDTIHDVVGAPYMCCPPISANDPIFYAHHTEIDHLWKVWLAEGGGRANPTSDTTWMNTSFKFYDETGNVVSLSVKDTLDTVTQLDYRYDDDPPVGQMRHAAPRAEPQQEFPTTEPVRLAVSSQTGVGLSNETIRFNLNLSPEAVAKIKQLLEDKQFRHAISLSVEIDQAKEATGIYYEIYTDLPANEEPTYKSIYYVGNLGLFLPKDSGITKRFDLTRSIRALMDKNAWDGSHLTITLVPRGSLSPDEKPLPLKAGVQATIKQVSLFGR